MKKTVIVLGGVDYEIDPLPIGVLREIDSEFADVPVKDLTPKAKEEFYFSQALKIIFHGLKTKNPAMDIKKIETIPSTMEEVFEARAAVLKHAGLIVDRTAPVGESQAAAS